MNRRPMTAALLLFARAYIDPGTGWILVTGFLGAMTSIAYAVRTYLGRAKRLFSSGSASSGDSGTVPGNGQPGSDAGSS